VQAPRRQPATQVGDVVCMLDHVGTEQDTRQADGRDRLRDASLSLRAGEIVAIAGVSGNGQVALAELLSGVRRAARGTVQFMGRPLPAAPARLVARGVARIPEDRHAVGVIGDLPVWENVVSERLRTDAFSRKLLPGLRWVRRAAARTQAQRVEKAFDVRGAGLDAPARSLSGGNMQKLILGRSLLAPKTTREDSPAAPRLIVAHQPTWGLDIGAVAYVQQQLIAARDAGAAVLLISDDLDEVLALGDRVAVMHGGHIGEPRPAAAWTREAIGLAMAGTHRPAKEAAA